MNSALPFQLNGENEKNGTKKSSISENNESANEQDPSVSTTVQRVVTIKGEIEDYIEEPVKYEGDPIDTVAVMTAVGEHYTKYKISQSKLARRLNIKQMFLSRMLRKPVPWERLQDSGHEHIRKLKMWLEMPLETRLQFVEEIRSEESVVPDEDVDTIQMFQQIHLEMNQMGVSLADYATGADIKYSWIYSMNKQTIPFEGLNTKGRMQARRLYQYLLEPADSRFQSSYTSSLIPPTDATPVLDTAYIAKRVNDEMAKYGISIRGLARFLDMDSGRLSVNLRMPPPWNQLHPEGRKNFRKLSNWLYQPDETRLNGLPKKNVIPSTINTEDVINRVKHLLQREQMSISALAKYLNMHTGTLSNMIRSPLPLCRLKPGGCQNYSILLKWLAEMGDKRPEDEVQDDEDSMNFTRESDFSIGDISTDISQKDDSLNEGIWLSIPLEKRIKLEPEDSMDHSFATNDMPMTSMDTLNAMIEAPNPVNNDNEDMAVVLRIPSNNREDLSKISNLLISRGSSFKVEQPSICINVTYKEALELIKLLTEQNIHHGVQLNIV